MFGWCVWYRLSQPHNLNKIISRFYREFRTQLYPAHITAEYNIHLFNKHNFKLDVFNKTGSIYVNSLQGFHSIQQDYICKTTPDKIYHVSLAYKVDEEFTLEELDFIKSIEIDKQIRAEDLTLELWDCNSKFTNKWNCLVSIP